MYQYEKHFSLAEAHTFLVRLEYELSELMRLKSHIDEIGFNLYTRRYRPGFNPDTKNEFPDTFIQLIDISQALADEGIILKGIKEGLVDFPALRANGEEVFLCWKRGEEDISFWHTLDSGFRGRRPIDEF